MARRTRIRGLGVAAAAILLATPAAATAAISRRGNALYTNAVTYCAEQRAVLIDSFDIAYWRANNSVTFSFSFASVESNLNVSANVYLNDYGNTLFNQSFDICSYVSGVLCPLPQVNFTGFGTYPLPDSLKSQIPSIAWTVPNLEAYARVELLNVDTGEVAACLQATLSNGWTTQWAGVKWGTAGLTLAAVLVALAHTALGDSASPAQYRWFDILYLFQTAASCGLLHLNYPLVFSNFAQNFAWSLGLLRSGSMQRSIDKMRARTGGQLSGTAYSDVQYINRALSPYNVGVEDYLDLSNEAASLGLFVKTSSVGNASASGSALASLAKRASIPSAVDQNATSDLTTGIPVYVNTDGIPQANALDTVFFILLAFIGIVLALHAVIYLVTLAVDRAGRERRGSLWAARLRRHYGAFTAGNLLRVCLVFFYPVFIFGFYQWTIGRHDSGLSLFWSIFAMLLLFAPLATVFVLSVIRGRQSSPTAPGISPLFTNYTWFHSAGVLYRPYRQRFHWYWFVLVLAMVARAGFIAFGQENPWAQVVGLMAVEFLVFVSLVALRPHKDRKGDWLAPLLSFLRLAAFGLLVAFIESVGVKAIIRTVIGIVEIAVFGIPTVLLFFGLIWNAGYGILWRRHKRRIEDGLEVERFVADDDDASAAHPAMAHVDAANFVTGAGGGLHALDATPTPDSRGGSESITRRASILEPVENVFESPSGTPPMRASRLSGATGMTSGSGGTGGLAAGAAEDTSLLGAAGAAGTGDHRASSQYPMDTGGASTAYPGYTAMPTSPVMMQTPADDARAASEAAYAQLAHGGGHARYDPSGGRLDGGGYRRAM